ncbi:MAG: M67 family metallopeptidase [Planctomycetota bacterium]|jgi:proteasome lid subunit RPN8/RPN11
MPTTLHIGQTVFETLVAHARRDHPAECCGILIGRANGPDVYADRAVEADNITDGDRSKTFQIDWRTLFSTVRAVRRSHGQEQLIGFYHSHPDGSAEPSHRDTEAAWPDYSYVIVSMSDAWCSSVTSWRIPSEGTSFQRERIVLL